MKPGQRVRLRAASPIAQRDEAAADAIGVVLCCYEVRCRSGASERLDVRFSANNVLWGVGIGEFEAVEDGCDFN
ncbi:MAG: hypothetical protein ACK5JM_09520 [Rhodoblastus sp.]